MPKMYGETFLHSFREKAKRARTLQIAAQSQLWWIFIQIPDVLYEAGVKDK